MKIYELVQCKLDEKNFPTDVKRIAFFESVQNIFDYLTKDGKTKDTISVVGHNNTESEYIKSCLDSPYATIRVHTEAYENLLIGCSEPAYDTFYYCRSHEIRNYGFFRPENKKQGA